MSLPARLDAPGFVLGAFFFALAVLLVPWLPNGADLPRWVLLAVIVAAFAKGGSIYAKPMQVGLAFLAWAGLSIAWSADPYRGVLMFGQLACLAGLFSLGWWLPSLQPVLIGAGLGFAVNSALVLAQLAGFQGVPQSTAPAGLFIVKNYLAEAAMLVLVGLLAVRRFWLAAAVAPAAILPLGRGAILGGLVAAGLWLWTKSRPAALALGAGGAVALLAWRYGDTGMTERAAMWGATLRALTPGGEGLGSFYVLFPSLGSGWDFMDNRPSHAHSDAIELLFELGPGALLLAWLCGMALRGGPLPERLMLAAFLTEAAVGFPLHWPATAALGALALGRLCRAAAERRGAVACGRDRLGGGAALERAPAGAHGPA